MTGAPAERASERSAARLLFPAVRWSRDSGFQREWAGIEAGIERGVGGFIVFGGEAAAVRDLTEEIRKRSSEPVLIASDLERGAGQQFRGATPLPPAAAIGSLNDLEVTRRAAEVTAREARGLGIEWVLAPVADVDLEPLNPIVGTRAFASDPAAVGRQVEAWVRGCTDGGALSCVKHFPGHGRTTGDSHVERPAVRATREELEHDLLPFRAAIAAGVDGVMAAHVAFPALDPSGESATRSAPILRRLLRERLRFDGIVATDAINMAGFSVGESEGAAAVRAVSAGCDALLYPGEIQETLAALGAALQPGGEFADRAAEAAARIARAGRRVGGVAAKGWGREEDLEWAGATAIRTLHTVRGEPRLPEGPVRVLEIDDDVGGPHPPPSRGALPRRLVGQGVELSDSGRTLMAVYADVRAWKVRPGLSPAALGRIEEVLASDPGATVLLFAHPRFAAQIPSARHVLAAWGSEPLMQEAVASWLTGIRS